MHLTIEGFDTPNTIDVYWFNLVETDDMYIFRAQFSDSGTKYDRYKIIIYRHSEMIPNAEVFRIITERYDGPNKKIDEDTSYFTIDYIEETTLKKILEHRINR